MNDELQRLLTLLLAMKAFHIIGWFEKNEIYESRRLNSLQWYAKRNKISGIEMRLLSIEEKASEILGAWTLMEMIASAAEPRTLRGWLISDGRALDAQGLAFITGHRRENFEAAIAFASRDDVAWLEHADVPVCAPEKAAEKPIADVPVCAPEKAAEKPAEPPLPPGSSPRVRGDPPQVRGDPPRLVVLQVGQTGQVGQDNGGTGRSPIPPPDNKRESTPRKKAGLNDRTAFAAVSDRIDELEKLGSDGRTEAQEEELARMRQKRKEIQDRQIAGVS